MCGIAGLVSRRPEPVDERRLEAMLAEVRHRGPDESGAHAEPGVAIGMTRLSIVDIASGHQPMCNEDGTVWVVYNGEIYNQLALRAQLKDRGHRFLTRCDTEVLVHGYEEWGTDLLPRLNGMFALGIWDGRSRRLLLARDRVGIKPLFYREGSDGIAFASELTALLADPEAPREIDPEAVAAYLSLEFVPTPLSLVRGIRTLAPAHFLTWTPGSGRHEQAYWDIPIGHADGSDSFDATAAELRDRLLSAVETEMASDVPLGVLLSGGIDSSSVAAMMVATAGSGDSVASFSVGFEDPDFDESRYAALVATHLGTDHHALTVQPEAVLEVIPAVLGRLDQPLGDPSLLPTYLVSRFAREHVKVVLGGDGGDELFGGYPTLRAHRYATAYRKLPDLLGRRLVPSLVEKLPTSMSNLSFDFKAKRFVQGAHMSTGERHVTWTGSLSTQDVPAVMSADLRDAAAVAGAGRVAERHLDSVRGLDVVDQVLYLDMKLYLEGDILTKVDRASMMNSLEARVPLLNADIVDYVTRLPQRYKVSGRSTKRLLRRAMAHDLPPAVLTRSKRGFALPLARWLRGPLEATIRETLSRERVLAQGLLDAPAVGRIIDDHMAARRDNRKVLWTMFVLQTWCERHLASRPYSPAASRLIAS